MYGDAKYSDHALAWHAIFPLSSSNQGWGPLFPKREEGTTDLKVYDKNSNFFIRTHS